jgi:hypothetical protein
MTTAQLAAFDAAAKENRKTLQTLKRNYVIKLFADHSDTQSIFASLAKGLERLIGWPAGSVARQPRRLSGGVGRPPSAITPGNWPPNPLFWEG